MTDIYKDLKQLGSTSAPPQSPGTVKDAGGVLVESVKRHAVHFGQQRAGGGVDSHRTGGGKGLSSGKEKRTGGVTWRIIGVAPVMGSVLAVMRFT